MRRVTEATLCTLLLAVVGTRSAAAGTITGVAAGSGLLGGGTNGAVILSANYGGDGVAQRVCHADHTHAGNTWNIYDIPIGLELAMHCTARDSSCAQVAVAGVALGAPGTGAGVYGSTDAVLGLGVWGENLAPSGKSIGIAGIAKSPDGIGVVGTASKTTGSPLGVQGNVVAPLGTGVQGLNYAVTGTGVGVSGKSFAPSGMGVSGLNLASTGSAIGVDGESLSSA